MPLSGDQLLAQQGVLGKELVTGSKAVSADAAQESWAWSEELCAGSANGRHASPGEGSNTLRERLQHPSR